MTQGNAVVKRNHMHMIVTAKIDHASVPGHVLKEWIEDVVHSVNMKVISGPHVVYSDVKDNEGWTGIAVLDFSHISVHLWPNDNLIEFDLFSCKDFDVNTVIDHLRFFGLIDYSVKIINRDKKFNV